EPPPAPANHYTDRCSQVRNFNEHTWGLSTSAITPLGAGSSSKSSVWATIKEVPRRPRIRAFHAQSLR
ncbi:hypothetical protein, partial [Mycolicibacterium brisbanense]|uniref:hypothetical protein n=1 Tax=Mycolicibacterium brisbanense TaxID=146020 RepID=UPI0021F260D3